MPILLLGIALFLLYFFGILTSFFVGWALWLLLLLQAILWFKGCRMYIKNQGGITRISLSQSFFFSILTVIFLIPDINKLNIILVAPLLWASVYLIAIIPLIGKSMIYADGIFFQLINNTYGRLVLIGIKPEDIPNFSQSNAMFEAMENVAPGLTKEQYSKIAKEADKRIKTEKPIN
jgi:hypothetical protein